MHCGSTQIIAKADKHEDLELINILENKRIEVKRKEEEIAKSHL